MLAREIGADHVGLKPMAIPNTGAGNLAALKQVKHRSFAHRQPLSHILDTQKFFGHRGITPFQSLAILFAVLYHFVHGFAMICKNNNERIC